MWDKVIDDWKTPAEFIDRAAAIEIAEKYGLTDGSVLGRHSGG